MEGTPVVTHGVGRTMSSMARRLGAALIALSVVSVGCDAGRSEGPGHPSGSDELVLRVELLGGFVAPAARLSRVPTFSLFGDGTVIEPGPQIQIYPPPALPSVESFSVSRDAVRRILAAARDAGLFTDRTLIAGGIADAPTTVFTLVADGERHMTTVSALSEGSGPGVPPGQAAARRRLAAFESKLGDLRSWLPAGSTGPERPYAPTAVALFVALFLPGGPGPTEPIIEWPLPTPLSMFGDTAEGSGTLRCGIVRGEDLGKLMPLLRRANQLTRWRSAGHTYALTVRPLLPDESSCPSSDTGV